MPLTLADVAKNPDLLTSELASPAGEKIIFRPLTRDDAPKLAQFLESLSAETREFYLLNSYDMTMAKEMCDAINRYDKLRLIVVNTSSEQFIALFEYSFDIPNNDAERFLQYGIHLTSETDCRVAPCVSDVFQNRKIGSILFPLLVDVARQFGRKRMILWGGVFIDNPRAIVFYEKNGFRRLGTFMHDKGKTSIDMMMTVE